MDDVLKQFLVDAAEIGPTPAPAALAALVSDFALDTDYWSHQVTKAERRQRRGASVGPTARRCCWSVAPTAP